MHGDVILFRGTGADALRYVEADSSRADNYYRGAETSVAQFAVLDADGTVRAELEPDPVAYAGWLDWVTGEQMGKQIGTVSSRSRNGVASIPGCCSISSGMKYGMFFEQDMYA